MFSLFLLLKVDNLCYLIFFLSIPSVWGFFLGRSGFLSQGSCGEWRGGPKLIVRINKTTSKMFYGATVGASAANERQSHAENLVLKNFFFMAALLKHKLELGDGDPRPLLRFFSSP